MPKETMDLLRRAAESDVRFTFAESLHLVEAYLAGFRRHGENPDSPQLLVLMGRHGVGKTSMLRQLAAKHKLAYASFHGGAVDSQDNVGLPTCVNGKQVHADPAHIPVFHEPRSESGYGLFVIEEAFSNDNNEFQNQLRQLTEGQLGELRKHPRWIMAATTNPPTEEYVTVNAVDMALADRLLVVYVEPTPEEIMSYMTLSKDFHPGFRLFLLMNRDYLQNTSPRALFKLAGMLRYYDESGQANGGVFKMLKLHGGVEMATAYEAYKKLGDDPDAYPIPGKDLLIRNGADRKTYWARIERWATANRSDLIGATNFDVLISLSRLLRPEERDEKLAPVVLDGAVAFAVLLGEVGHMDMGYPIILRLLKEKDLDKKEVFNRVKGTRLEQRALESYNCARLMDKEPAHV